MYMHIGRQTHAPPVSPAAACPASAEPQICHPCVACRTAHQACGFQPPQSSRDAAAPRGAPAMHSRAHHSGGGVRAVKHRQGSSPQHLQEAAPRGLAWPHTWQLHTTRTEPPGRQTQPTPELWSTCRQLQELSCTPMPDCAPACAVHGPSRGAECLHPRPLRWMCPAQGFVGRDTLCVGSGGVCHVQFLLAAAQAQSYKSAGRLAGTSSHFGGHQG